MRRLLMLALFALPAISPAADALKAGKLQLQSGGPITFGPEGIIFVGDPKAASIYAVQTGDTEARKVAPVNIAGIETKLAALLGVKADEIQIHDVAVNPASNRVYLSVSRGKGPDAIPAIFRVNNAGELEPFKTDSVPFAKAELSKPVEGKRRQEAITGMKFVNGKVYVAGLSNEEFASTLRVLQYPFDGKDTSAGVQIYHGAHGKYETASPVRTFAPITVNGQEEILAAYTCTPLVRIPAKEIKDGAKVKGTTVAELGNHNRPLDIIVYTKGDKAFALMANSARGVMKVALEGIEKIEPISTRVKETAGLGYETIADLKGVEQLDKLSDTQAILLVRADGVASLKTIDLP